jgi:RNA polymerase sigma-70 factor (ECF subfamily)
MAAELPARRDNAAVLEGFSNWMSSEQRRVYLLCLRLLRDRDDADSAAQDAFLKAYRALERNPSMVLDSPERWLSRIAVNVCLDRMRSERWRFWRKRVPEADANGILDALPDRATPEDALLARDIRRRLEAALEKLSSRQRTVFVLKHEEDRSLEEIGELLGLSVGAVKAHMARAVQKLRGELRDLYARTTLDR